jgi:hypothetical protein
LTSLADAAIDYAERGISVFPLRPRAKQPNSKLAPHGYLDASTNVELVRSWWEDAPDANIGLVCAPKFLVLDEDPRNGGDQALEDLFMQAPRYGFGTLTSSTGGGGRHFVFQHPQFDVSVKDIGRGLDIKSKGYIVAPPSIHPSGRAYEWQDPDAPITVIPDWLLQIITSKGKGSTPKVSATTSTNVPIGEGQRNDALFRIGCSLRSAGLSESAIAAALTEENRTRCVPPLPETEVRLIAGSAGRYTPGRSSRTSIGVDVMSAATSTDALVLLNALPLWQGLIRWTGARRCGNTVILERDTGDEVRIDQQHFLTFSKAQTAIWSSTGIVIPTPKRTEIRTLWEQAGTLIGKICMAHYQSRGGAEDDTKLDLIRTFRAAGWPAPSDRTALFSILTNIRNYRRVPHADAAPPCVFCWDGRTWVHPATLQVWLGTVTGGNRRVQVGELREHFALLGFEKGELEAEQGDERVHVDLWQGSAQILEKE